MNCAAQFTGLTLSPMTLLLLWVLSAYLQALDGVSERRGANRKVPGKEAKRAAQCSECPSSNISYQLTKYLIQRQQAYLLAQSFGALSKGLE